MNTFEKRAWSRWSGRFLIDAGLIAVATFVLFGEDYVSFMFLHFFMILALFTVKFRLAMLRAKRPLRHEE